MKKLKITVDGHTYEVDVELLDQSGAPAPAAPVPAPYRPAFVPAPMTAAPAPASAAPASTAAPGQMPSPLAGKVVEVHVQPGDSVTAGQNLITLEAMKMNTLVSAPADGVVTSVLVKAGDMVQEGQGLLSF